MKVEDVEKSEIPDRPKSKWMPIIERLTDGKVTKITLDDDMSPTAARVGLFTAARRAGKKIETRNRGQTFWVFLKDQIEEG